MLNPRRSDFRYEIPDWYCRAAPPDDGCGNKTTERQLLCRCARMYFPSAAAFYFSIFFSNSSTVSAFAASFSHFFKISRFSSFLILAFKASDTSPISSNNSMISFCLPSFFPVLSLSLSLLLFPLLSLLPSAL